MGAELTAQQMKDYRAETRTGPIGVRVARASLSPAAKSGPLVIIVPAARAITRLSRQQIADAFEKGTIGGERVRVVGLAPSAVLGEWFRDRVLPSRTFLSDYHPYAESVDVVRDVESHPDAVGFCRMNLVTPKVRVVASYERYVYLFIRDRRDPLVNAYVAAALSPAGQAAIASTPQHYRPLTPAELAEERAHLRL